MEQVVTIAIPDVAGPSSLASTLASLARHTPEPHEIVVLEEKLQARSILPDHARRIVKRVIVPAPFGIPAGLNLLLASCTTPYMLLLESGAIVTAGWLGRLLAPMNDQAVGLSGPSTNSSWNEQKILAGATGANWSIAQIDQFAASIAARYAHQCRPLDTLHSLGDFCYLFKRAVAEQLGGFDEAYGSGPCWEIDFTTRAARAGFRALWVMDAYVHRANPTPWKIANERSYFTASKQLYQDRFCGLRLRGEKATYETHCRGEACEHFAPTDLIQITLPRKHEILDCSTEQASSRRQAENAQPPRTGHVPLSVESSRDRSGFLSHSLPKEVDDYQDVPLVSCIMPTRNRRELCQQALRYFERQDYPKRELIIVDDGNEDISDLVAGNLRVRYIRLPRQVSIGAKRNRACQEARGAIIAHWDDDDWYAPHRLRHQVAPLLAGTADITGLETSCFFDVERWQGWSCTPTLHRRLFVGDVHGGTLVYWRKVWEKHVHYPDASLAEDALFLREACRRGMRLSKLPHANSFVYVRHTTNAWRFPLGTYIDPSGWQKADLAAFIPLTDITFYAARSPAASLSSAPLVSCIMPTYNRRPFVPQAIRYFLRQDYANRELIILDDGDHSVEDLIPSDSRIRYIRLAQRMILGAKRNLACEKAQGSIIAHWDDDDWIAPHRLSYQVAELERSNADLCGAGRELYYDPVADRAWFYEYPPALRRWLAGNTLCYRKAFWAKNRFPNIAIGEDTHFTWSPLARNATVLADHRFYVGLVHAGNTSRKTLTGPYWHPSSVEEVRQVLGEDLEFYRALTRLSGSKHDVLCST
jgi:glycosyltransferase involved in cell wall biosynthesis